MALDRWRGRMPLIAFVLLALICLGMFGFACACLTDQAADRALQAPALTGLTELWAVVILLLAPTLALLAMEVPARARASPAQLQRFLF